MSLDAQDIPTIMGITLVAAVVTLFSYLLADILYVVVDPRISYE
jgi:peptide/nickel transport system permease protein